MSQTEMVLEYIHDHGSITSKQATDALGCTRLAARIADLEMKGYSFNRATETSRNRWGKKVHFTRYSLRGDPNG